MGRDNCKTTLSKLQLMRYQGECDFCVEAKQTWLKCLVHRVSGSMSGGYVIISPWYDSAVYSVNLI